MTWQSTIGSIAATPAGSGNGPIPPDYNGGAYGYVDSPSNPNGVAAATTASNATYFGATIVAICNDQHPNPLYFQVSIQGTYDATFLGTVTTPDGYAWNPAHAVWSQYDVAGVTITSWTWTIPSSGEAGIADGTVSIADSGDTFLELSGVSQSSTQIDLTWTNTLDNPTSYHLYKAVSGGSFTDVSNLPGSTTEFQDTGLSASTEYQYYVEAVYSDGTTTTSAIVTLFTPSSGISATFNCNCQEPANPNAQTLAQLRNRMAIRCGYGAQVANLAPGVVATLNEYLLNAQNQLYRQHDEIWSQRMYAWQMEIGQRYYGFAQDESDCRTLDPLNISWVGFEDLNQAWYSLISGIDPVLYTRAQISTGWPTHYEIRACIEIFPAPKAQYTLWIKGRFPPDPFTEDDDLATIDSEAIYLLACGMYKSAYAQPDASQLLTQADNYTKYIVAKMHGTRRYVPRTGIKHVLTPPNFLPVDPGYTGP